MKTYLVWFEGSRREFVYAKDVEDAYQQARKLYGETLCGVIPWEGKVTA